MPSADLIKSARLFTWFLLAMSVMASRTVGDDQVGIFFRESISPALWGGRIALQVYTSFPGLGLGAKTGKV